MSTSRPRAVMSCLFAFAGMLVLADESPAAGVLLDYERMPARRRNVPRGSPVLLNSRLSRSA